MEVPAGAVCVLLGPSGCGKTTTMKMINRLIPPTSGKIYIDGRDTAGGRRGHAAPLDRLRHPADRPVPEQDRRGQYLRRARSARLGPRAKSRTRAAELLDMVNLDPAIFLKRYPKELSGGQQQRVGVVRALAADPPVLLMDEPFGAIDPINREVIQDEFMKLQAELKKTIVFVSHDIDEAVKMASHIAIFRDGRLIQYDTPDNILAHPVDAFVAEFVGGDRTLKRLRLIKVADAMMANPPSVRAEDTLETAIARMSEHGHISIVMVGPRGRARGMIRIEQARDKKGPSASMWSRCRASSTSRRIFATPCR